MTKTLFILGPLLLLVAGSALAGQTAAIDWGSVKTLYGGAAPSDIDQPRAGGGNYGTLTPVEPTLTAPDLARTAFILGVLRDARRELPDLDLWRDSEFGELLDGGDRGDSWLHKVVNWIQNHVTLSTNPSGITFQVRWDGGCLGFWHEFGGNAWSFGAC